MAWDINRVTLVGRLAGDVELKYISSGTAVAKFGLAVGGKPRDGQDTVSFFNVVVWGKMGENCSQYLSKGKQVCVDGRLEQRRWQTQDGSNRSTVEVVAERVQFLSQVSQGDSSNDNSNQGGFDPTPVDYDKMNQDDIPF